MLAKEQSDDQRLALGLAGGGRLPVDALAVTDGPFSTCRGR